MKNIVYYIVVILINVYLYQINIDCAERYCEFRHLKIYATASIKFMYFSVTYVYLTFLFRRGPLRYVDEEYFLYTCIITANNFLYTSNLFASMRQTADVRRQTTTA